MFDNLINKITEKMGHSVKTQIVPIKDKVEKTLDNKMDLYSKLLKVGVLICLFIEGTRKINNSTSNETMPSHITINNYINRKEDE